MKRSPQNPKTPEEWQLAVNLARFYLVLEAARQYGLVEGGPEVHSGRCIQLLRQGKRRGYSPAADAVSRVLAEFEADAETRTERKD
jgi:hypothetical protein